MNAFANWISGLVHAKAAEARAASASGEVRLFFHGPPLEILERVFDVITQGEHRENLPIVLQVPELAPDTRNPLIGETGRCDESHLLDLRNSPEASSYLALMPPGQQAIRSVSSTTDDFGVGAAGNGTNASFEDWLSDPFVQECLAAAIAVLPKSLQDEARKLVVRSLRAVDDVDGRSASRSAAWALISRIFTVPQSGLSPAAALSLACGVPPMAGGTLSAEEQQASLDGIATALSDGFQSGVAAAQENAAGNSEVLGWLDDFLRHIRATCDVPTALERAPEPFYAPALGLILEAPPPWWSGLTAELWADLLTDEPDVFGQFGLECHDTLLPPSKGMPLIVEGEVKLAVSIRSNPGGPVPVSLERSPGKNKDGFPAQLEFQDATDYTDRSPPLHKTPIQYKARADGFRPASVKVISLKTWEPGLFVACRHARKVTSPRAPSRKAKEVQWEASVQLPGPGRFELIIYLRPGALVSPEATGVSSSSEATASETTKLPVREIRPRQHQVEIETEGAYQVDVPFERPGRDGVLSKETCRIYVSCDDVDEEGCRSEYERLIKLNRRSPESRGAKSSIQINRSARCSSLQAWMLLPDQARSSYLPIVLGDDYAEHWVQPTWNTDAGRIISGGRYLKDPRPASPEFSPPTDFLDAREELAERIRGTEDQSGLIEASQLGDWLLRDNDYQTLVERYLDAYTSWFSASPEIASWADVVVVATLEPDKRTLARIPDAILLSPLHPVRLAWHSLAQSILWSAAADKPCPAAGILDPKIVPDLLRLPVRSPEGLDWLPFLSVETNSDYWSVLWNGAKLRDLPRRSLLPPFDPAFGIGVGGISTGFSASQVARALEDVSNVLCAKPMISVVVSSAGGTTDSCNQGLIEWSAANYTDQEVPGRQETMGRRLLDVFDIRDPGSWPDEATIANLSDDTANNVRWHVEPPKSGAVDLGIIAQLDSSEPEASETTLRTPMGAGGLLRHRVRRQLPGAFLSESRQAQAAVACGNPLADKIAASVASLENSRDEVHGLRFAPNVYAISDMLERKSADFVAISSSAIDPACFLGGWLEETYLWDYDLPSYSQRAGDTNGYYVLSKVKSSDRDGMKKVLARLPGCAALPDADIGNILLEVARRGIPTIRGLSGDDTGATGDLGLFVAARLLQDRFRLSAPVDSLLPVISPPGQPPVIALVIPVDPFRNYLDDLSRILNRDVADASLSRPDLLVVAVALGTASAKIRITPVEVKSRPESNFSKTDSLDALGQAKALGDLLARLSEWRDPLTAWNLAYKHLLLSIIGFGMRVYSQHRDLAGDAATWAIFHERIAQSILADANCVTIDRRGRLIVVDDSVVSEPRDNDGDGFEETIVISREDAARVVAKDASNFYESVRAKIGDWELLTWPDGGAAQGGPKPQPSSPVVSPPGTQPQPVAATPPPALANNAPSPAATAPTSPAPAAQDGGIKLAVGQTEGAFERRGLELSISDTRLNNLNMGVVGDLGTGKTQLLKSLVYQITASSAHNRGIRPRVMVFDYKRDYSSPDFVAATGARVVRPHKIPLNLFDTSTMEDTTVPWLDRFRFFADVLDKIYSGIGPVQRDKLKRAVRSAYEGKAGAGMPTIYDVHEAYASILEGKSDSPMAIIDDLVDMEVFERDPSKTLSFDSFLDGVVVVSLDALGQDDRSKNMLVAVMLNMFYENMLRTPKRPFLGSDPQLRAIASYLLVDEADNIMRYEFDVLRKLLLQGREFGCGVILASQYLRHFKVNATDYREPLLTWFVHKVPNVSATELAALGLGNAAADMAERVKELPNHYCLFKSHDTSGLIIRGLPFYELMARGEGG